MTISLSYLDDLSRVRVALSDLPDGTVQVQRAANAGATDAIWQRGIVRGGSALPIESGSGQIDDFEFFADVATHYRVVPVDPPAGLLLAGVSGDYASTPDHASLDITGDQTLVGWAHTDDWTAGTVTLAARYLASGDNRAVQLRLVDGVPQLVWSTDGAGGLSFISALDGDSNVLPLPADAGDLALQALLDVDNGNSEHEVSFWVASDPDGAWQQWGVTRVLSGTTSVATVAAPFEAGARNGGTEQLWTGRVYRTWLRDGLATDSGTLVADARFDQQTGGSGQFTDPIGRQWTVHGDAYVVGIEQDDITASLDGQVWLKSIKYPSTNRAVRLVDRGENVGRGSRSTVHAIVGRSVGVATHDRRLGRQWTLHVMTAGPDHAEQAGDLDIILAAGGTFFVHVPATLVGAVPGGYVAIDSELVESRLYRGDPDAPRVFSIPCTNVAPPRPTVTGTLLTGATILRLYGSGQALISAHPTGRSLLATMLDPDDLVVV